MRIRIFGIASIALTLLSAAATSHAQVLSTAYWGSYSSGVIKGTLGNTTISVPVDVSYGTISSDNWNSLLAPGHLTPSPGFTSATLSSLSNSGARIGSATTSSESISFSNPTFDPIMLVNYGTNHMSLTFTPASILNVSTSPLASYNSGTGLVSFNNTNTNDPSTGIFVQFNGTYGNGTNGYNPLTFTLDGTNSAQSAAYITFGTQLAVPEPGSCALLIGLGVTGLMAARRKRK